LTPASASGRGRQFAFTAVGLALVVGVVVLWLAGKPQRDPSPPPRRAGDVGKFPGEERIIDIGTGGVKMSFCWCPPGKFMRGNNDGEENEKPVKEITISKGFWTAKAETTQAQWTALGFKNESYFKGDDMPVENVSQADAVDYAEKL